MGGILYKIFLLLFAISLNAQQLFEYTPRQGTNKKLIHNAQIYIVHETTDDSLLLTEYGGSKSGTYYKASVATGTYKIYIQKTGFNSGVQTLVKSNFPFGVTDYKTPGMWGAVADSSTNNDTPFIAK